MEGGKGGWRGGRSARYAPAARETLREFAKGLQRTMHKPFFSSNLGVIENNSNSALALKSCMSS
jgi:hypothetical protein